MKSGKKLSLLRLYQMIIVVMIPTIIVVVALSLNISSGIADQVLQSSHANIQAQIKQLEKTLSNVNYTLLGLLASDENIAEINRADATLFERNQAILGLKTTFTELRNIFMGDFNCFFYDRAQGLFIMPTPVNANMALTDKITRNTIDYIRGRDENLSISNKKWRMLTTESGIAYLVKIYRNNDSYVGAWIEMDKVYANFMANQYSSVDFGMAVVQNGEIVTQADRYQKVARTHAVVVSPTQPRRTQGIYEIAYYSVARGEFSFVFMTNVLGKYQSVRILLIGLVAALVGILGLGVWLLVYVHRQLLRPINAFVNNLSVESLQPARENPWGRGPRFAELDRVDMLFRSARAQIEELKIAMYENELERQRMEMEYLQLQIKPHFFVNCMSVIYNMAQSKHFEAIQRLSLSVSNYLRTVFAKGSEPVTLEKELAHVRNYLNINMIRYEGEFNAKILLPRELKNYLVAPLLIHTMAENCVKHAITGDNSTMCIAVDKVMRDGAEMIHIAVSDNGPGFKEDVLLALNASQDLTVDGRRIGLSNLRRRLAYFYHGRGRMVFSNPQQGGALVEVWIPAQQKEVQENT